MKLFKALIIIAICIVAVNSAQVSFSQFASDHKKQYSSAAEAQKRQKIFESNLQNIDKLNAEAAKKGAPVKFGITKFSDMDISELEKGYMGFKASSVHKNNVKLATTTTTKPTTTTTKRTTTTTKPTTTTTKRTTTTTKPTTTTTKPTTTTTKPTTTTTKPTTTTTKPTTTTALPVSFDWTQQAGIVSSVKNQGGCGSCWAFATQAVMESYYARKGYSLTNFSPQQLVDCNLANYGCGGGDPRVAFSYEIANGSMPESSYPYTGVQSTCKYDASKVLIRPTSQAFISTEADMLNKLVQYGPLEIAIYANPLQSYTGGILTSSQCSPTATPNHAVTLVGYGVSNGVPYWKVKNSWGTNWGESGYFRLQRNTNTCNLLYYAIYIQ